MVVVLESRSILNVALITNAFSYIYARLVNLLHYVRLFDCQKWSRSGLCSKCPAVGESVASQKETQIQSTRYTVSF